MSLNYPFSAIVGQNGIKTALMLVTIDPKLGGLLISGPRGSAKSTLVRGLQPLLGESPFVTLPLGATEEMICGSFNLESALQDSEVSFQPGLLNRADQGLLYVDEVNLLADHLVDLLLDAAASGVSVVERDGISHEQSTQFSLIGTMNPDEGELRPQLLDRFGLMANISNQFTLAERKQVVTRRVAFDSNPQAFIDNFKSQTDAILAKLAAAKQSLDQIKLSSNISEQIAKRCDQAGVDGLRADITLHRAAKAHAALLSQKQVSVSNLDAVQDLVFNHRTSTSQSTPPPRGGQSTPQSGSDSSGNENNHQGSSIQGSWGASSLLPESTAINASIPNVQFRNERSGISSNSVANTRVRGANQSNQWISRAHSDTSDQSTCKPDWRKTLFNMAKAHKNSVSTLSAIQYKQPLKRTQSLDLLVLDCSASTFSGNGFSLANQAIQHLSNQCYLSRRWIGVIAFGNSQATITLPPQRAPKDLQPFLKDLPIGGGTPVEQAFDCATDMLNRQKFQHFDSRLFLITDGRLPNDIIFHSLLESTPITIVDIESSKIKLALGKTIADSLNADYLRI